MCQGYLIPGQVSYAQKQNAKITSASNLTFIKNEFQFIFKPSYMKDPDKQSLSVLFNWFCLYL